MNDLSFSTLQINDTSTFDKLLNSASNSISNKNQPCLREWRDIDSKGTTDILCLHSSSESPSSH